VGYPYQNKYLQQKAKSSRGGLSVTHVLALIVGAVIILGLVIVYTKQEQTPSNGASANSGTPIVYDENYYKSRGLAPNQGRRVSSGNGALTTEVKPHPTYVGSTDWDRYHLPSCKHARDIPADKVIWFNSVAEARAKNYVPCKVCNPPASDDGEGIISVTPSKRVADPPLVRETNPGAVPVQDVQVSFTYKVIDRRVKRDKSLVEVDFEVEMSKVFTREDALKVAQKLVYGEIKQNKISAASIFVHTPPGMVKCVCLVEWAPYGNLARAGEVKAGDYRNHRFTIELQGFLDLKRR
jgi:hypothetical protein